MPRRGLPLTPSLTDLARVAGKSGVEFGVWINSEEVQEILYTSEHVDSETIEASFCDGRREYRMLTWKMVWTTAPAAYDYADSVEVLDSGLFEEKSLGLASRELRRVLISPRDYTFVTARYGSGMHGVWDEDPRILESRAQERIANQRVEREQNATRRAEGLAWLVTQATDEEIEYRDANWQARGLNSEDAKQERDRRRVAREKALKAEKWAECAKLIPDGATLIDPGAPGYYDKIGYIRGREPHVWFAVKIVPGWSDSDNPETAKVVGEGAVTVGSLTCVAQWLIDGRIRVAGPEDHVPPAAVLRRLGFDLTKIRHADISGSVVWVGCPAFAETMVLDSAGHLVRSKKVRELAIRDAK
jgi:hypothetical protein